MIIVRRLGLTAYPQALERMRSFIAARAAAREATPDELWLTEHDPVFTLGFASRPEHLLDTGSIPVVATERGGQVTYHGPGQVVAYVLLDLRRRRLGVRELVKRLEQGIIDCLAASGVTGQRRANAPGIFVVPRAANGGTSDQALAKIASIGLKVSGGLTWHGLALNAGMDLSPFARINPCGFPGLVMTDILTEVSTDFRPVVEPAGDNDFPVSSDIPVASDLPGQLAAALAAAIDG